MASGGVGAIAMISGNRIGIGEPGSTIDIFRLLWKWGEICIVLKNRVLTCSRAHCCAIYTVDI